MKNGKLLSMKKNKKDKSHTNLLTNKNRINTERELEIKTLKAEAYDRIALVQNIQNELIQINNKIIELENKKEAGI